ncbi:MAG: DUF5317 domain-containing protein [Actinomycetota bacterium]|nr:DUF5317 domain-containing protein [Actinomycetota bacterium]
MFFLAVLTVAVVTVPLFGGTISALGDVRLRAGWTLAAAIGIQIVIISILPASQGVDRAAHLASYALAGGFIVANIRIRGLWITVLGGLLNAAVITANGGVMVGSAAAFRSAGMGGVTAHFSNSIVLAHPKLLFLGDVWSIPAGFPFATPLSIGDLLIAAGAVVLVHALCGSRLFTRNRVPLAPGSSEVREAS